VKPINLDDFEPQYWTDSYLKNGRLDWKCGIQWRGPSDDDVNLGIHVRTARNWRYLWRLSEKLRTRWLTASSILFSTLKTMAPDATDRKPAIFNLGGGNSIDYNGRGYSSSSVTKHVTELLAGNESVYRVFNPEMSAEVKRLIVRAEQTRRRWWMATGVAQRATEDRLRAMIRAREKEPYGRLIDPCIIAVTPHRAVIVDHDTVIKWIDAEMFEAV